MKNQLCLGHLCPHPDFIDFDDPILRERFEKGLLESDIALKPLTDALDASEHLTEQDLDIIVQ